MAPEQATVATTDARADIWAVGVILHQMLFGRLPEKLAPEAERVLLPVSTPARSEKVLLRTLSRDPEARYPDAAALVAALVGGSRHEERRRLAVVAFATATLAIALLVSAAVAGWRLQKAADLWQDPLANARYQRLTDFEGAEHSAAISRDGRFAAFLSSRDGPVSVFLTEIGSGTFRNVTRGHVPEELVNREIRTLEFSPDGGRLFFWVGASDTLKTRAINTWVVPTLAGEPRLSLEGVPEVGWSPDGKRLAYHTTAPGDPIFVKSEGCEAQLLYTAPVPRARPFPDLVAGRIVHLLRAGLSAERDGYLEDPLLGGTARTDHLPQLPGELSDVPGPFDAALSRDRGRTDPAPGSTASMSSGGCRTG